MVRGRRPNGSLPETKALKQQREFRAKKAEKLAELEAKNRVLAEENQQLRLENQLLRDHLLSADTTSALPIHPHPTSSRRDGATEKMAAVRDVQGQLERALEALRTVTSESVISAHDSRGLSAREIPSQIAKGQPDLGVHAPQGPVAMIDAASYCLSPATLPPTGSENTSFRCREQGQPSCVQPAGFRKAVEAVDADDDFMLAQSRNSTTPHFSDIRSNLAASREEAECCLGVFRCDEQGDIVPV